jgi:hypothetical protein
MQKEKHIRLAVCICAVPLLHDFMSVRSLVCFRSIVAPNRLFRAEGSLSLAQEYPSRLA